MEDKYLEELKKIFRWATIIIGVCVGLFLIGDIVKCCLTKNQSTEISIIFFKDNKLESKIQSNTDSIIREIKFIEQNIEELKSTKKSDSKK